MLPEGAAIFKVWSPTKGHWVMGVCTGDNGAPLFSSNILSGHGFIPSNIPTMMMLCSVGPKQWGTIRHRLHNHEPNCLRYSVVVREVEDTIIFPDLYQRYILYKNEGEKVGRR